MALRYDREATHPVGIATYPAVRHLDLRNPCWWCEGVLLASMAKEYAKLTVVPGEEPPGEPKGARIRSVL